MIRPIPNAIEFTLRSADELAEVISGVVETYDDGLLMGDIGPEDLYRVVCADTVVIRNRPLADRELAAGGIL